MTRRTEPILPASDEFDPDELTAGMHPAPLRRVARGVAVGAVLAAALSSEEIARWAFDLPFWLGPVHDVLVALADAWHAAMQALGLDAIRTALTEAFRAFQSF